MTSLGRAALTLSAGKEGRGVTRDGEGLICLEESMGWCFMDSSGSTGDVADELRLDMEVKLD